MGIGGGERPRLCRHISGGGCASWRTALRAAVQDRQGTRRRIHGACSDLALPLAKQRGVRSRHPGPQRGERVRNTFAKTFLEAAQKDARLCVVVADISPAGAMDQFRKEFPERFINTGVAEQIMIGMCAGMSMRGLKPFAYTIATFALYRPFEFIRDDLCYQDLPVTVVGIGGGVAYSTLGGTHHAQEDIAVMSALPNMAVIAPCDPLETEHATWACAERTGP